MTAGGEQTGRMAKGRIAVIGGSTSWEHEESLASAAAAEQALTSIGYEVESLTIDLAGTWWWARGAPLGLAGAVATLQSCAVAVPMLSGSGSAAASLAALCDLAGVPCVGSGMRARALATDRWLTKLVAEANGVRTAAGTLVRRGEARQIAGLLVADLPMVIRPATAGARQPASLARTPDQLVTALELAFARDDRILVEEVVAGPMIEVAVLGRPDATRRVATAPEVLAPLPPARRKHVEEAAITIYDALGCAGVAQFDFVLTDTGPVLREASAAPEFTEHSPVPRMFAAAGISYPELLDVLVTDAQQATGRAKALV